MSKIEPETPAVTIETEVIAIVDDASLSDRQRIRMLVPLIISNLEKRGKFYTSRQKRYYFSSLDKEVFYIKSDDFIGYISHFTGLNQLDSLLAKNIKGIDTYIRVLSKKKDIDIEFKVFSHFDKLKNELYIHNNKSIVFITKNKVKVVENGFNDVIFRNTKNEPWELLENVDDSVDYLRSLIRSVSFSDSMLPMEDIYLVFEYYVYSLFLPELFESKVILNIIGDMGSGKSFILSMLYKIFYGERKKLSTMPSKDDGLEVFLANNSLVFLDNVELKGTTLKSKIDIICAAATGVAANKRMLFTDGDEFTQDLSTNIGFSAIQPEYNRRDLSERSLVFFLNKRPTYSSGQVSQSQYIENRDIIMTMICHKFMEILQNIEVYDDYESSFRMADFSNFLFNNFENEQERMVSIFEKLTMIQQTFTSSNDLLLILLEDIFDSGEKVLNAKGFYSANELNKIFSLYSSRRENKNIKYPYNARTLGRALNDNIDSYKNSASINIAMHMKGGNQRVYSISRI